MDNRPIQAPVRLAIVGCGLITEDSHLPAILRSSLVKLVALIDNEPKRASALARMFGCEVALHTRLEEVVDKIDGVLIATPNFTHATIAKVALANGVPALIEKPLTTSYASSLELCELADRNGTFISVGYFSRHFPVVSLFKRLLDEGFLGALQNFHFELGTAGGWTPVSAYNLDRQQSGGGVLVVRGTHFLDRMIYWFGMPKSFSYADDSYGGVEANCKARVDFDAEPGEFSGTLFFSKTIDLKNKLSFETSRYFGEIRDSETEEITLFPKSLANTRLTIRTERDHFFPRTTQDCFQAQIEDFARAIRQGTRPLVDGRDGSLSVKLFEDFYAQRTQLPEPWRLASKLKA